MADDKIHLNWDDVYKKSLQLADMIKADSEMAEERFDYMVVIPRGGYFPANIVARQLGFGVTDLLHACVGSYEPGANKRQSKLAIGEMPEAQRIKGKRLLVIDEVCDTGETLEYIVNYLTRAEAKYVRCGVLHFKPANSSSGYKPDWSVNTTDKWIVYPWEEKEYTAKY